VSLVSCNRATMSSPSTSFESFYLACAITIVCHSILHASIYHVALLECLVLRITLLAIKGIRYQVQYSTPTRCLPDCPHIITCSTNPHLTISTIAHLISIVGIRLPTRALALFPKTVMCSRISSRLSDFSASIHRSGLKWSGLGKIVELRCTRSAWYKTMTYYTLVYVGYPYIYRLKEARVHFETEVRYTWILNR
jgi:hypothetical protein